MVTFGISSDQAALTWYTVSEADSYVRYKQTSSSSWIIEKDIDSNLYVIDSLVENTEYEYQVRSHCPQGPSDCSASYSFVTRE